MNEPIDTGGPAFPFVEDCAASSITPGMTLRDYFAAKALPTAMRYELGPKGIYQHFCDSACERMARNAYAVADAMLEARGE